MPEQTAPTKMKVETKVMLTFLVVGVIAGIASWAVGTAIPDNRGPFAALAIAIFVLVGLPQILKKPFGVNQKFKWWLTNGGWAYIFVWFIVWIIFYNVL